MADGQREIMIATPTSDGICTTGYVESIVAAIEAIHAAGFRHRFATLDYFDVITSRNHLAMFALRQDTISHLLFIDNDMRVHKHVFQRLIASDKPVVGAIYTRRKFDLEAYAQARIKGHPHDAARALASPWILRIKPGKVPLGQDILPVEGIGFGAALVSTRLMRAMIDAGILEQRPALPEAKFGDNAKVWDFFGEIPLAGGGALSDDFSFCKRANDTMANAVWGYAGPGISHQGHFDYGADFKARLRALASENAQKESPAEGAAAAGAPPAGGDGTA